MAGFTYYGILETYLNISMKTDVTLQWDLEKVTDWVGNQKDADYTIVSINSGNVVAGVSCKMYLEISLKSNNIGVVGSTFEPTDIKDILLFQLAVKAKENERVTEAISKLILQAYILREHLKELPHEKADDSIMQNVDLSPLMSKYKAQITKIEINKYMSCSCSGKSEPFYLIANISCRINKTT